MRTDPPHQTDRAHREQDERVSHNLDRLHDFIQAAIADASVVEPMPDGALLVFPDDTPAVKESIAAEAARQGRPVARVNLTLTKAGAPR